MKCPLTCTKENERKEADVTSAAGNEKASREEAGSMKTAFGPWMVVQKNRRRPPKGQRGTMGIPKDATGDHAAGDKGGSSSTKEKDLPKTTRTANGQPILNRKYDSGSRFSVLEDQMDIETASVGATDEEDNGGNHGRNLTGEEVGKEVVMEAQEVNDAEGVRVCINASHPGLADKLRPLEKVRTSIKTQAQASNGGPRKNMEKPLRDVTNRLDPKPVIGKATRVDTRLVAGQKRPSEFWKKDDPKGLPNKSLFDKVKYSAPNLFEDGPSSKDLVGAQPTDRAAGSTPIKGKPPDPRNAEISVESAANPSFLKSGANLGVEASDIGRTVVEHRTNDVWMADSPQGSTEGDGRVQNHHT